MNEIEIRKIAKEEFISNVMNNLDSTLIFAYIQNLERKANNLQSKIDKANEILDKHFQDDEGIVCKITGEYEAERNEKFIKELKNILKEDK